MQLPPNSPPVTENLLRLLLHDLGNTVSTFHGLLEFLDCSSPEQEEIQSDLLTVSLHAKHLLQVAAKISRETRRQAESRTTPEPVRLAEVCAEAVQLVCRDFADRQHAISCEVPDALSTRVPMEEFLADVLVPILHNACSFSPAEEKITLRAGVAATGEWNLWVTDRGIGIPGDLPERVLEVGGAVPRPKVCFEKTNPQIPGTGLHLPLAKILLSNWGGALRVTPNGEDPGTCVEIRLPVIRS